MKKKILMIACIVSIFVIGCSQSNIKNADSLEDAYFDILNKNINEERVTKKYLTQLLSGYKYKKGETFKMEGGNLDGSDYIQQPYEFSRENEKLIITHSNYNNVESIEPLYTLTNELGETSISYLGATEEIKGEEELDSNRFMVSNRSFDMNKHIEISNKLNNKKGQWDDIYHIVSNNVVDINDMDIESIKELVKVEPSLEEYEDKLETDLNHKVLVYNFETDEEMLMVEYLKDINKIWRVMYVNKDISTIKNIANKKLLKNEDELHTGILTYVENPDMQRDLLKTTTK